LQDTGHPRAMPAPHNAPELRRGGTNCRDTQLH
jgi:hypothetical protein